MSTENLRLVIEVDAKSGRAEIKEVERALDRASRTADDAQRKAQAFGEALDRVGKRAAIAASAITGAFAALSHTIVRTSADFEQYAIRLQHVLASTEEGNRLFQDMVQFASRVPFEFDQIMASATALAGVVKGGAKEVSQWMPLIADLAAVSGLSIREATDQVIRMMSAGAAAADLFRERGVLAMLGFQAGVSYSAEETKRRLIEAWRDPASKFRGAAQDLANTWDGLMSMMADKWTLFRKQVGDAGAFDAFKAALREIDKALGENSDAVQRLAITVSDALVRGLLAGADAAALAAKALTSLQAVDDVVRLGIDELSAAIVDAFDSIVVAGKHFADFWGTLLDSDTLLRLGERAGEIHRQLGLLADGIRQTQRESEEALGRTVDNVDQQLSRIDAFARRVKDAIIDASGAASALSRLGATDTGDSGGGGGSDKRRLDAATQQLMEHYRERARIAHEMTQAMLGDEIDLLLAQQEQRQAILDEQRQKEIERVQQQIQDEQARREAILAINQRYDELETQLALQTTDRIVAIEKRRAEQQLRIERQARDARLSLAAGAMGALSQLLAQGGRRAFEASKALAVAETVVSTYAAAQKAYESQLSIPTPDAPARAAVAAAIAVAQGIARVQAIMRQQYGRAAGASAAVGGGGAPATPGGMATRAGYGMPQPIGAQQQAAQPVQVHITVQSDTGYIDPGAVQRLVDELAPRLQDAFGRGRHLQVAV